MKKGNIITTITLVLIIIALSVGLVVTNLPKGNEEVQNTNVEETTTADNGNNNSEEGKILPNDGEVAQRAYDIVEGLSSLWGIKGGVGTAKDLSNNEILLTAYSFMDKSLIEDIDYTTKGDYTVNGKFKPSDLAAAVKSIFGDIEYNDSYFGGLIAPAATYVEDENMYYRCSGYGGGGYFSYPIHGIYKVEEFSDRYVVTGKMLFIDSRDTGSGTNNVIKAWSSYFSKSLGYFGSFYENYPKNGLYFNSLNDVVADVTDTKNISVLINTGNDEARLKQKDTAQKMIAKYIDDATEYKHTFMKAEDGSFYWLKSEIVK